MHCEWVGTLGLVGALLFGAAPGVLTADSDRGRIRGVSRWIYVLQGQKEAPLPLAALAQSDADLLVIDATNGGDPLTRKQIEGLQKGGPTGRRIVLAYVSLGEAEVYRTYWKRSWKKKPPAFLDEVNPRWEGNFKVRYWMPEWQAIARGVLERVVNAGFDGAYLDIIDAYEYWGPGGAKPERPTAAADMADFVAAMGAHVRKHRPGFLLVPQNGSGILDEAPDRAPAYLAAIDAIGAEDTFFFGDQPHDNPYRPQLGTITALRRFAAAGKPVLAVDYLTRKDLARRFVDAARRAGFVPYVGARELDRVVPQPSVPAPTPSPPPQKQKTP